MPNTVATRTEWMKVSEAASEVGVDPRTIKAMIADGRLQVRSMQFDLSLRIHREDWRAEMAKRLRAPASA